MEGIKGANQVDFQTSSKTLKIAILKCDEWSSSFAQKHGNVEHQYINFLKKGAKLHLETKVDLSFEVFDCRRSEFISQPKVDEFDCYVITGSKHDAYSTDPEIAAWIAKLEDAIRLIEKKKKKLLGVCFGHQVIAQALGGKVENIGWNLSHQELEMDDHAQKTFGFQKLRMLSIHQDQVTQLPPDCHAWAWNSKCKHQGMRKEKHIFTFQPHPEFSNALLNDLLAMKEEILSPEYLEAALKTVQNPVDNDIIAKKMMEFLLEPATSS